ncbi:hypothetical protein KTH81_02385 [Lachnospiraceae bacterium ASD3451]|uniref:hypothetical protein n=1 Tax=Diplocloster agilis TaxID=2850323 RepID=UPI001D902A73|nr:hypothetical protein [Diplocloster agilis]MBU9742658.1 hypothetical protein [Diplocloster agilis]
MQVEKGKKPFVGYEYKKITVNKNAVSMYLDCYKNFGWFTDENVANESGNSQITVQMKRDRKLINRVELTRLQKHFEACANEIETLEKSKTSTAAVCALVAGVIGTGFMAGSTFAVTHEPPVIWLCAVLAVPGFAGWLLPYFLYHFMIRKRTKKVFPLIEAKREEIYEICEKGHSLL